VPNDSESDSSAMIVFAGSNSQRTVSSWPNGAKKTCKIHRIRAQLPVDFSPEKYILRPVVETVFFAAKHKLSCRAPGRTIATQAQPALLLGVADNIYRLWLPVTMGMRLDSDHSWLKNGLMMNLLRLVAAESVKRRMRDGLRLLSKFGNRG
jgi:hypothetical protein